MYRNERIRAKLGVGSLLDVVKDEKLQWYRVVIKDLSKVKATKKDLRESLKISGLMMLMRYTQREAELVYK